MLPFLSSFLKDTFTVFPSVTVAVLVACFSYLTISFSLIVYVPIGMFLSSALPLLSVVTVYVFPLPVTVKVIFLIISSSDVLLILRLPNSTSTLILKV